MTALPLNHLKPHYLWRKLIAATNWATQLNTRSLT